ncbi:MAG: hypothetical protein PHW76_03140 [Alphaproteobacteria bacterium]|nr:hypothetical protein [Alphaproteobacteria bacterium]
MSEANNDPNLLAFREQAQNFCGKVYYLSVEKDEHALGRDDNDEQPFAIERQILQGTFNTFMKEVDIHPEESAVDLVQKALDVNETYRRQESLISQCEELREEGLAILKARGSDYTPEPIIPEQQEEPAHRLFKPRATTTPSVQGFGTPHP